jgi:hypothetical protein
MSGAYVFRKLEVLYGFSNPFFHTRWRGQNILVCSAKIQENISTFHQIKLNELNRRGAGEAGKASASLPLPRASSTPI